MTTYMPKREQVQAKWLLVDADGLVLGRMAAKIAPLLMGKHKTCYAPHVDTGDFVVVVNADKVKVTGRKADQKQYQYYTKYPGGQRIVDFADLMARKPEKVIELAVKRMLPKNKLGRKMLKKLRIFRGGEHEHQAQRPQKVDLFAKSH